MTDGAATIVSPMANAEESPDRASVRQPDAAPPRRARARTVIVGIDGSEAAAHALRWAANKTALFGEIVPMIASSPPRTFVLTARPATTAGLESYQRAARNQLNDTVTAEAPSLLGRAMVVDRQPGPGLVEAAADADLLVVGTRGQNAVAATLLGSVSAYCVNYGTVPVALVPPDWAASRPITTVVVGVDGSDNAKRALEWVVQNIAPHLGPDGKILAVGALPVGAYADAGYDPWLADLEERLGDALEESVSTATDASYQGPSIETRIELQDPRVTLPRLTEAEGDLLVIGARGTSGLGHLQLGSVANALVRHPKVATIVVPATRADETSTE